MSNKRRPVRSLPLPARRFRLRVAGIAETRRLTKLALVAGVLAGMLGCNASVPPPAVEAVGQLAASYHSIAVAPVHHDAPPEMGQVIETPDDDQDDAPKFRPVVEQAQAPDVVDKSDGIKTGEVR